MVRIDRFSRKIEGTATLAADQFACRARNKIASTNRIAKFCLLWRRSVAGVNTPCYPSGARPLKVLIVNNETVFFTIITQNYVPQARCLFESLRTHHPDARHVLCLVDHTIDDSIFRDDVEVILAKDCVGEDYYGMAYRYSLIELSTAVKPFVMDWLTRDGAKFLTYIDPDCFLFSPLREVMDLFDAGTNIVLTPHTTEPIDDAQTPGEIDFLRAGTFNLGFVAVRDSDETRKFLKWWSDRLRNLCMFDPVSGLFVDQKWVDLAPSFFEGVTVLRHPGYNVAYWNAFQRSIRRAKGGWHVDGKPLRFFHFSALPKEDVDQISRHQDRLDGKTLGPFISEFHTYLARLASNALKPGQERPYAHSLFWRGQPVESQALRSSLRRANAPKAESAEDFHNEAPVAGLLGAHPDLPVDDMFPISPLLYDAWLAAPVMARQYPLFTAEQRAKFFYWVLVEGHAALQIDRRLLPWRELTTPVPGAIEGRLGVPPILWLVWLSDQDFRRTATFEKEESYAALLIELQRQIAEGERPSWILPPEYTGLAVMGEGNEAINVAQYAIWCARKDLQSAFDLDQVQGRRDFNAWCNGSSPRDEYPWMVPLIARSEVEKTYA